MKSITLFLILIALSIGAYSQKKDAEWLNGDWKVGKATLQSNQLDNEQKQMMQVVLDGFTSSIFSFKSSGQFNLKFKDQQEEVMKELYFLENAYWKTDSELTEIQIGTDEDNFSLMGLNLKIDGDKVFFLIQESSIILEMKKIN